MLTINYCRLGTAYADYEAERVIMQAKDRLGSKGVLNTCTVNVVRASQLLIAENKIDPIDIRFQYEGQSIKHDRFGRFFVVPTGYDETIVRLHFRYRTAVQQRILNEMSDKQREAYNGRFKEWLDANIVEIFTPAIAADEDREAVPATKFIFAPDHIGQKRIEPDTSSDLRTMLGFGETQHGILLIITDKGPIPLHLVEQATFDTGGDRMVPRPFNTAAVLDELGFDGSFFARPGFEVE